MGKVKINGNFELINIVQIINNNKTHIEKLKNLQWINDSNFENQITRYSNSFLNYMEPEPEIEIRYMFNPRKGKLVYSRGRIFLIFEHYYDPNIETFCFDRNIVTFNDSLQNMDFGLIAHSDYSFIQSVTFDKNYFVVGGLIDDLEPKKIHYISKRDFYNDYNYYDPINKQYNLRFSEDINQ